MAECIDIPPPTQPTPTTVPTVPAVPAVPAVPTVPTVPSDEEFAYSGVGNDTLTPEQVEFTEARIDHLQRMLLQSTKDRCSLFVYGRSKAGKTSLINALLHGKSSGGNYSEKVGTKEIQPIERRITITAQSYKSMTVYDTVGLCRGLNEKKIKKEILQNCAPKQMDGVIVCQCWTDPFEEENLRMLHSMDPRIWTKTIFAMTKFDQIPPEIEDEEIEQTQTHKIMEKKREWEESIKNALRRLEVKEDVIQRVQIVFTTHTAKKTHNWRINGEQTDYNKTFIEKVFNSIEDIDQYLAMRNPEDDILTTKGKIRQFLEDTLNMPIIYAIFNDVAEGNMEMVLKRICEKIFDNAQEA